MSTRSKRWLSIGLALLTLMVTLMGRDAMAQQPRRPVLFPKVSIPRTTNAPPIAPSWNLTPTITPPIGPSPQPDPDMPAPPGPSPIAPVSNIPRTEIRGVWMTNNDLPMLEDRTKVRNAMSQLRTLNFNTIYPVVWNSGYVNYPSSVAARYGIQPFVRRGTDGHDILADLVSQAHGQNLMVIPWFEFGFMVPQTAELATLHPDWLTETRDGTQVSGGPAGEVAWLNPMHPEVQRFLTELVMEAVNNYDIDGVQFDDNLGLPREFGYDVYTKALYQRETKKSVPSNPADGAWVKWRADKITAFVKQLNQSVKARKPKAIFSISPNYYDHAYKLTLQDWLTWVRQGLVDEVIMQVYRSDLNSFTAKINRPEIIESQQRVSTAIGILTGLRRRPVSIEQIKSQTRTAQQRGLGVSYFYYESLWEDAPESLMDRIAGFQFLFPNSVVRSRG
jgi:uncharacterized lipoprotein YddW (UPF0748 family)